MEPDEEESGEGLHGGADVDENQAPAMILLLRTVLPREDLAIRRGVNDILADTGRKSISISVGNDIFDPRLTHNTAKIPGIDFPLSP